MTKRTVRILLCASLMVLLLASLGTPSAFAQKKLRFGVSLYSCIHDFPARLRQGFVDACKELGVEMLEAVAQGNVNQQINDIDKFITMKVDAVLVWPGDPSALANISTKAMRAKVPFFTVDSCVFGGGFVTAVMSDNYHMGEVLADFIAQKIGGKGNVALMNLPMNEVWGMRTSGAKDAFAKYPGIKIVNEQHVATGGLTSTAAAENIIAANPTPGSLQAIWAAADGLAVQAAQVSANAKRPEIITGGIDGERGAIDLIRKRGSYVLSLGQSPFMMAWICTHKAVEHLQGKFVPRLIISPTWMITKDNLPVVLPEAEKAWTYDNIAYIRKYGALKDRI